MKVYQVVLMVLCLVLGAVLLFWPGLFSKMNQMSKTWIATDKLERELNKTRDMDAKLFGARKILGLILLLLAVAFIVMALR